MTLERRLERLEDSLGGPDKFHSLTEEIREKIKAKIPRLIKSADGGDDHSLKLLMAYCPGLEAKLTELAENGNAEAQATLERLHRARAEREALLANS